jgi:hypothetical protein
MWTFSDPTGSPSRLFVGGTRDNAGGMALLNVKNGGKIIVETNANQLGVKVGVSGTVTGNGTIRTNGPSYLSTRMGVLGTLSPSGMLKIDADLGLAPNSTTLCHVTPSGADSLDVYRTANIQEQSRLLVIMTGQFTPHTTFTLLHAEDIRIGTFESVSIQYPPNLECFTPVITYDANNVYLYLKPCG